MTEVSMIESEATHIQEQLAAMQADGLHRFEPVQFCYLTSMAKRALNHNDTVAQAITTKVQTAISEYQTNYQLTHRQFSRWVETLSQQHPEQAERLQEHLAHKDFKAIRALASKLQQANKTSPLKALAQRLSHINTVDDESPPSPSFEQASLNRHETTHLNPEVTANSSNTPELRSLKDFRNTLAKEHAENRLREAIANAPENAGPLNPEKLVIRSLSAIRDLSPDYLNRFIAYMDTLLWLEQAANSKAVCNKSKARSKNARSKHT